jgi:hypothetical protein
MTLFPVRCLLLLGLLLLAECPAAATEGPVRPDAPLALGAAPQAQTTLAPPVLIGGWSIHNLFSSLTGRTRIVQACAVFMCIALFIMMRRSQ